MVDVKLQHFASNRLNFVNFPTKRNIVDIIENFFTMIYENCINSDNSTILKKILEIMHLLLDIKISAVANYRIVIQINSIRN